jgi:hypothetical protein
MFTFKQYLREGGNIKIGEVAANPVHVTEKNRNDTAADIHRTLGAIHDSFHREHGGHLFGKGKKALVTGSAYAGSTSHLMNQSISDAEYAHHKPTSGDIDAQIPREHKEALAKHLTPGKKSGNYTVIGTKKHGNEVSAVMRHKNGQHHQFDFEATDYSNDEPTKGEQFLHSSNWEDTKKGIKGAHHKILLNAVGGDVHKFSITHGLRSRTNETAMGIKDPKEISHTLFGKDADHKKIHSFQGLAELIKKHINPLRHQEIYDKFKSSLSKKAGDHSAAIEHLKKTLGTKDILSENEQEEHHTTVVPLTGFSPFSHMGHEHDLGAAVKSLPGTKHIGISSKSDLYSPEERSSILRRQWGGGEDLHTHVVNSAGETIARAHASLPKKGRKILHLVVGNDRRDFAEGLKKSLEAGKIKEMEGKKFDEIRIHTPKDSNRSHGMSGTNMRNAAVSGNLNIFRRHLGSMFSIEEAKKHMKRVKDAIMSGKIKVKR